MTSSPVASAMNAAVSWARFIGDDTIAAGDALSASAAATDRPCWMPKSVSGGSSPPEPLNFFSNECFVAPWRTRRISVGFPTSAQPIIVRGGCAAFGDSASSARA